MEEGGIEGWMGGWERDRWMDGGRTVDGRRIDGWMEKRLMDEWIGEIDGWGGLMEERLIDGRMER